MELLIKSIFLTFLGMKVVLELAAVTLFYEWQKITNSKFQRGMTVFLLLLTAASIARSLLESSWHIQITTPYLTIQAIETAGWALFVYIIYKIEE